MKAKEWSGIRVTDVPYDEEDEMTVFHPSNEFNLKEDERYWKKHGYNTELVHLVDRTALEDLMKDALALVSALEGISTAHERNDDHESAAHSNYARLKASRHDADRALFVWNRKWGKK